MLYRLSYRLTLRMLKRLPVTFSRRWKFNAWELLSSPRHWALTDSRPSADVTLIILRVADLVAALLEGLLNILLAFFNILPSAMRAKPTGSSRQ